MTDVRDRATGQTISVDNREIPERFRAGEIEPLYEGQEFTVTNAIGQVVRVKGIAGLEQAFGLGGKMATEDEIHESHMQERYGQSPVRAFGEGLLRGGTFGLYDAAAQLFGASGRAIRETRERHGALSLTGEIVGGVIPSILSGPGAIARIARSTPAGLIDELGRTVQTSVGGGLRGHVARGAVEGAAAGVGETISQVSTDPLAAERAGSVLSSNLLLGTGIGAGVGVFAGAAEKGIRKAKEIADNVTTRLQKTSEIPEDLTGLDAKELRVAKEAEIERLEVERGLERHAMASSVGDYQARRREVNPFLIADGDERKVLAKASNAVRRNLDNPKGLAQRPYSTLDAIQREEKAFQEILRNPSERLPAMLAQDVKLAEKIKIADNAKEVTLKGQTARRWADWSGTKLKRKQPVTLSREDARHFKDALAAGDLHEKRLAVVEQMPELLDQNLALQQRINNLQAKFASPRLKAIADASDDLIGAGKKGGVRQMAEGALYGVGSGIGGAIPFVGGVVGPWFGAQTARRLGDLIFGRLGKATNEATQRMTQAINKLLTATESVTRTAPMAASKALARVSFGDAKTPALRPSVPTKRKLADLYRDRENELQSQIDMTPAGPRMSAAARRKVYGRLAGVRLVDPVLSDQMEAMTARRVEFLASKLFKRPHVMAHRVGPEKWAPPDMEIAKFARYVNAIEDPMGVMERAANHTITPEDVETLEAVYPELFAEIKMELMQKLPTLKEPPPYATRLTLSMLFGVPVDPAMAPGIVRVLQSHFEEEPGTEGGTQAPTPKPQFGSVKKAIPEPTAAQERAG